MIHATWTEPGLWTTIEYSLSGLEQVRRRAVDGLLSLPRIGLGVGGLLLGPATSAQGPIRLEDSVEIPCSHGDGPSFALTTGELEVARQLAAEKRELVVVGFYFTKTRGSVTPSAAELHLFGALCPHPWQIMLVLRPSSVRPSTATVFYRETGGKVTQGLERDLPEWAFREEEANIGAMSVPVVPEPAEIPTPVAKLMFSEPPPAPRARNPVTPAAGNHGPQVHFTEAQPRPATTVRSNEPVQEPTHAMSVRFSNPPPAPAPHSPVHSNSTEPTPAFQGPRVRFAEEQPKHDTSSRSAVPLSAPARGPSVQFSAPPPPPSQPRNPDPAVSTAPVDHLKNWFVGEPPPPSRRARAQDIDTDPDHVGAVPDQPHGFQAIRAIKFMPEDPATASTHALIERVGDSAQAPPPPPRPSLLLTPEEAAEAANSVPSDSTGFESINRIQLIARVHRAPVPAPSPEDFYYTPPVRQPLSRRRKLIMGGVAGLLAVALAAATSSQWLPQTLKLELSDANGHVTALWNAEAVDRGATGTLTVIDGALSQNIPLNAAQVASGVVGFDRQYNNISATLRIGNATAAATGSFKVVSVTDPVESARPSPLR